MKIIHNVTLDVSRKGIQCSVPVTQHDSGTHRLVIRLRNGITPLKPEEGDGAVVYLGKDMYDPVTVYTSEGAYPNCLVYDVTPYATAEAGEQTAVLQVYRAADGMVYSPQFTLFVREDVTGGSLVLSSPQYAAVVKAQNASEIYAERAENAERSANASKEAASESAAIASEAQARAVSVGAHIDECLGENGEKLEFVKDFAQSDVPKIKGRLESAENALGAYEGEDGFGYPALETENPAVIPALNELLKRLLSLNGEVMKKAEATDPVTGGAFSHEGDLTATGEVRAESVGANTVTAGKIGADRVTAAELVGNVRAETVNAVRLNVTGTATVKDYEEIAVRDSVLVLNSDGEDVSGAYSGIVIRADGDSAYAILLDGSLRTVRLGYGTYDAETNAFSFGTGDGGAVLTRDDSGEMTDGGMLYWDASAHRARQAALDAATAEKLYSALKDVGLSDYNGRYLGVDNGELKLISAGKLVSVSSVEQTTVSDTDGGVNVATVTLTDGTQSALRIKNGSKGDKGEKGDAGEGLDDFVIRDISPEKLYRGKYLSSAGVVTGDDDDTLLYIFPVAEGKTVTLSGVYAEGIRAVCALDENFSFVKEIPSETTYKAQKITVKVEGFAKIGVTTKESYTFSASYADCITNYTDGVENYTNKTVTVCPTDFKSGYIYMDGVSIYSGDSYYYSPYIEILENQEMELKNFFSAARTYVHFYDENKKRIEFLQSETATYVNSFKFVTPYKSKYLRFNIYVTQYHTFSLCYVNSIERNYLPIGLVNGWYTASHKRITSLLKKAASKPICTVIDDDTGSVEAITRFRDACNANGIKGTFACLTRTFSISGLKDTLLSFEREGHQTILHGYNQGTYYQNCQTEYAACEDDVVHGLQDLHNGGFTDYKFWATPFGIMGEELDRMARRWGIESYCTTRLGYESTQAEHGRYGLNRTHLDPNDEDSGNVPISDTYEQAKLCSEENGWLLICTHFAQWGDDVSRFNDFVSYAKSLGFEFMTYGEAWRIRKPIYELYEMF